jgi:hypothetical protein
MKRCRVWTILRVGSLLCLLADGGAALATCTLDERR